MKVARFSHQGTQHFGIVDGEELVLLAGDPMFSGFETLDERVPIADVKLLAPVIPRSKVICVGLNYAEHRDDMSAVASGPSTPLIFLKPNTAVVGPNDAIQLPPGIGKVVHEGELVVVIGKIAKQIRAEDFADHVFGYTIGNDVSARDLMVADGQWTRAKGFDTFAPIGPWIETELDPQALEISTTVDGEPRRHGFTSNMIHGVAEIVAFASDVFTLLPGDIIMTGTPGGLGGIEPGQSVDITIAGIGTLTNPVVARP